MDFKDLVEKCISETKEKVRKSVKQDILIIQATKTIEELEKIVNTLIKRVRDWYAFYSPEVEHSIKDNEAFVRVITSKSKKELLKELNIGYSMGSELNDGDVKIILDFARAVNQLVLAKKEQESYQEKLVKAICPNTAFLIGYKLTAKLLELAGSLERLVKMPSSTIQLLGAEAALFRHLRTGAKPPKYGILHEHPLVAACPKEQGKVARALADKIGIAIKVDFFKGELIGNKLKEEIEKKFGKW